VRAKDESGDGSEGLQGEATTGGPLSEIGVAGGMNIVTTEPRHRSAMVGYLLYLPAALMFALNGTVSKQLLLGGVDSLRLTQLRVTSAFFVLLVFVSLTRPAALRLRRSDLSLLLMYGVAGVALTQWLYFVAIERLPVGVALLIEFTAPLGVALWVRFAWHQPVRNRVWGALVMCMVGLAMVGQVWDGFSLDIIGVLAGFVAAGALVVYYLAGERGVRRRDPVSLTMWGFGAASVLWAFLAPWWSYPWATIGVVHGDIGPLTDIPGWWLVAYMVLFGTVFPFALVLFSLRHLTGAQASVVGLAEPLLASAIAWAVLGEALTPVQILGGTVVLIGVVIAENSR
jgi:drug/metabolite transporter (DMT)-like permease